MINNNKGLMHIIVAILVSLGVTFISLVPRHLEMSTSKSGIYNRALAFREMAAEMAKKFYLAKKNGDIDGTCAAFPGSTRYVFDGQVYCLGATNHCVKDPRYNNGSSCIVPADLTVQRNLKNNEIEMIATIKSKVKSPIERVINEFDKGVFKTAKFISNLKSEFKLEQEANAQIIYVGKPPDVSGIRENQTRVRGCGVLPPCIVCSNSGGPYPCVKIVIREGQTPFRKFSQRIAIVE